MILWLNSNPFKNENLSGIFFLKKKSTDISKNKQHLLINTYLMYIHVTYIHSIYYCRSNRTVSWGSSSWPPATWWLQPSPPSSCRRPAVTCDTTGALKSPAQRHQTRTLLMGLLTWARSWRPRVAAGSLSLPSGVPRRSWPRKREAARFRIGSRSKSDLLDVSVHTRRSSPRCRCRTGPEGRAAALLSSRRWRSEPYGCTDCSQLLQTEPVVYNLDLLLCNFNFSP